MIPFCMTWIWVTRIKHGRFDHVNATLAPLLKGLSSESAKVLTMTLSLRTTQSRRQTENALNAHICSLNPQSDNGGIKEFTTDWILKVDFSAIMSNNHADITGQRRMAESCGPTTQVLYARTRLLPHGKRNIRPRDLFITNVLLKAILNTAFPSPYPLRIFADLH